MLVGDPVAFVVAESVDLAKDAAERIAVEYEPLPAVTAIEDALSPAAPKLWAECRDNECFFFTLGDKRAVEKVATRNPPVHAKSMGLFGIDVTHQVCPGHLSAFASPLSNHSAKASAGPPRQC